jgi:hypothetical protein
MPYYDVIADYRVNPRARHLEELTRSDVCEILKIKPPARRWIVEDEFGPHWFENDVFGWCSKDGQTIFIRHDCSPFQIANVLVHEARHAWQIRNPRRFPIPGKTYSRTLSREQAERDCRIFEAEFWRGKENRSGSFEDITNILTNLRIANAQAALQAASHYPVKQRIGPSCSSSYAYPASGKTRLFVADTFLRDYDDEDDVGLRQF